MNITLTFDSIIVRAKSHFKSFWIIKAVIKVTPFVNPKVRPLGFPCVVSFQYKCLWACCPRHGGWGGPASVKASRRSLWPWAMLSSQHCVFFSQGCPPQCQVKKRKKNPWQNPYLDCVNDPRWHLKKIGLGRAGLSPSPAKRAPSPAPLVCASVSLDGFLIS